MNQYSIYKNEKSKNWILLLHGYGQDKESLNCLFHSLKNNYNVININLPISNKFKFDRPYKMEDILYYIKKILEKENINIDLIIGHSCGGKIAFAYSHRIKKVPLILIAPSLLKPNKKVKKYIIKIKYKLLKKIVKFKWFKSIDLTKFGSQNYKESSGYLRATFLKMIHQYYDKEIMDFDLPVVIYLGNNDKEVPNIKMIKKAKKQQNITYFIINGNHFAYKRNVDLIIKKVDELCLH